MYRNLNTVIGGLRPLQTPFVGVLGSAVPSTGDGGRPGWLYTTVQASGWGSGRVAVWVESSSRPGLFVNDNTSWTWDGLIDGIHTATGRVYLNGVDQGTSTLTLTVGAEFITITVGMRETGDDTIAMVNDVATSGIPVTLYIAMVEAGDDIVASTVDVVTPVASTVDVSMAVVELNDDIPGMSVQITGGGVQIPGPDPYPVVVWPDNGLSTSTPERRYKQPSEVSDFDVDYSRWFARRTDQPLTASATIVSDGVEVTLMNYWLLNQRIKIMVAGGVNRKKYKVTTRMTTTSGAVEEAEFFVHVREQ
jgi:hypothetical protein